MKTLLSADAFKLTVNRLAHQLTEDEKSLQNLVFIGIQPRGTFISDKIMEQIERSTGEKPCYGKLDITFYRDDVRQELHAPNQTIIPFSIEGKTVVFIDDVLYTGRTIRAALDALMDFGRPSAVKLCVLINRKYNRELPIQPDYTGITINTKKEEKVKINPSTGEAILY